MNEDAVLHELDVLVATPYAEDNQASLDSQYQRVARINASLAVATTELNRMIYSVFKNTTAPSV